MTNKYLEKIAASMSDEKDTAKTFGRTWLAGHTGTVLGAAAGGAILGSPIGRKLVGRIQSTRFASGVKNMANTLKNSSVGITAGKWFGNKTGPAAVGGIAGGIIGGDIGDYAGIRHGILEAKKNKSND